MKFEDVLAAVNGFGRFQMMVVLISFVSRFTLPCHFFLNNFIAAVPSHHCDLGLLEDGGRYGNLTRAQKLLVGVPVREDGTPDSCRMFLEPQYGLLINSSRRAAAPTVPCRSGWVYDNSTFKSTLTSEVSARRSKRAQRAALRPDGLPLASPESGTWCVTSEGRTKPQPPSSLLESCLEPSSLEV